MDSTSHPLLYFPILVVVVALSAIGSANASIHIYGRDPFREVGNALLLSGGSEGILASRTTSRSIHSAADDGHVTLVFRVRTLNETGTRSVGITALDVTVGAIRRTVERILMLCVSMGYELLNITEYVGTINDIAGRARVFLVFPIACLDAFLILWIFTSLSKTLEQLQILAGTYVPVDAIQLSISTLRSSFPEAVKLVTPFSPLVAVLASVKIWGRLFQLVSWDTISGIETARDQWRWSGETGVECRISTGGDGEEERPTEEMGMRETDSGD
ncbi:hypothetical protein LguiA_027111 [Lonicera macranthoides]